MEPRQQPASSGTGSAAIQALSIHQGMKVLSMQMMKLWTDRWKCLLQKCTKVNHYSQICMINYSLKEKKVQSQQL